MAIVTPYALPDEVRAGGTWVNNILAALTLYLVLHVMQADVAARNALEDELRAGIDAQQLVLHYQPQIGAEGQVIGAEALVRWQHPQRGLVPPGEFIPIAEASGLIAEIDGWVLRQACRQMVQWQREGRQMAFVAVNISSRLFGQHALYRQVAEVLHETGLAPAMLELEVTESAVMEDPEVALEQLHRLRGRVQVGRAARPVGQAAVAVLARAQLRQVAGPHLVGVEGAQGRTGLPLAKRGAGEHV